jgi:uncharacterized membrane protein YfcA
VTQIDLILPAFVPLNLALSCALVARAPRRVNLALLAWKILPAMAVGFPIGLLALERLPRAAFQRGFALFVLVLALLELTAMVRRSRPSRALPAPLGIALLVLGGIAHGAFATGGPPVVYVCGRTLPDKASFRATMSALWLVLNAALVVAYAVSGRLTCTTLAGSAKLAPGLLVGILAGNVLHARIPERAFRGLLFGFLLVVAAILALRRG